MGIFDYVLVLSILILYGAFLFRRSISKKQGVMLLSIMLLLAILHLTFGFVRWQLYASYALYVILFIYVFIENIIQKLILDRVRVLLMVASTVILLFSLSVLAAFPVYQVPEVTGSFKVGTMTYDLQDDMREELYSDDVDVRRFKVQVFYPVDTIEGYQRAKWIEDGKEVARALARDNGLPFFVLDHIVEIDANSYIDAPISEEKATYPVVVISHGWRGFRNLHTDFAEELASYGFIVFTIDHTYGSVATVFEDDVAYLNLDALPDVESEEAFLENANRLVNTYAADVVSTIDFIEDLHEGIRDSMFEGRIALDHIGLMGHSTGGGADVAVALQDDRISSVLGLDAWVEPLKEDTIARELHIPSVFLRSESWEEGDNNPSLYQLVKESNSYSKIYQIDGTTHFDFAMVYMYSPLTKYIGFTGSIESSELTSMLREIMVDFFDETLKQEEMDISEYDRFDEVVLVETP